MNYFKTLSLWKKIALILVVLIIAAAVPLTINQLKKQQENRSRASGGTVTISFIPSTSTITQDTQIQVALDGADNNVSSADIGILFDPVVLEAVSFTPASTFNSTFRNTIDPTTGKIHYSAVSTAATPITGSAIPLGTIVFRPKTATGTTTLNFENIKVTASGVRTNLPVNLTSGNYTIGPSVTGIPSPTTPANPSPSPTPLISTTPVPSATPVPTTEPTPTPIALCPPIPLPTTVPGATQVSLDLILEGIGTTEQGGNPRPLTCTRPVTVYVLNGTEQEVTHVQGSVAFDTATKTFKGVVNVGSIPTGAYIVKVKSPRYLRRRVPGIITITQGQTTSPLVALLRVGDANEVGTSFNVIDIQDFNIIRSCFSITGTPPAICGTNRQSADLNDDGIINEIDINLYKINVQVLTGD